MLSKIIIFVTRNNLEPIFSICYHSCELLSKIIIFVTRNNKRFPQGMAESVVNCFQKLLSSWHETTQQYECSEANQLWIAFKNYYLRDTKQPIYISSVVVHCCELLSKIIIFVTRNNPARAVQVAPSVVNCFQKLLSSWHETTVLMFY